jgi:pSer/pThr/pTyr-binding forkhead associated (FHA) protein
MVRNADGRLVLVDLKSRNGTFLNGKRLEKPTPLSAGDVINIGDETLELVQRASRQLQPTLDTSEDDSVTTVTERNAIGLVEELVARAAETNERSAAAPAICDMIDAILDNVDRVKKSLGVRESVRLSAAAHVVAHWFDDKSLDSWLDQVRKRIEPPR